MILSYSYIHVEFIHSIRPYLSIHTTPINANNIHDKEIKKNTLPLNVLSSRDSISFQSTLAPISMFFTQYGRFKGFTSNPKP
jgi:hypothetical protein